MKAFVKCNRILMVNSIVWSRDDEETGATVVMTHDSTSRSITWH